MPHPIRQVLSVYKTGRDALSPSEYLKILAACGTQEDKVWFMTAVALGLRRNDLFDITWGNVHLEKNPPTLTFHEHKKDRRDPDTGDVIEEMWRTLHLPPTLVQELTIYRNQRRLFLRARKKVGKRAAGRDEYVFTIRERQAYNRFQTLCDAAGVRRRPFHALRATMVKRAFAAGWSLMQVCEVTGDTPEVIQKFYDVPSEAEMEAVTVGKPVV